MTLPRADFRRLVKPFSHFARLTVEPTSWADPVVTPQDDLRRR
jgi:hypothetical protein